MTLPLVALIAFLVQPRLLYIMSIDGLFPKCLGGSVVRGISQSHIVKIILERELLCLAIY